jgi:hypothetical protein
MVPKGLSIYFDLNLMNLAGAFNGSAAAGAGQLDH